MFHGTCNPRKEIILREFVGTLKILLGKQRMLPPVPCAIKAEKEKEKQKNKEKKKRLLFHLETAVSIAEA